MRLRNWNMSVSDKTLSFNRAFNCFMQNTNQFTFFCHINISFSRTQFLERLSIKGYLENTRYTSILETVEKGVEQT